MKNKIGKKYKSKCLYHGLTKEKCLDSDSKNNRISEHWFQYFINGEWQ